MRVDLASDKMTGDDAACLAVDDDEVEHLRAWKHCDRPGMNLPLQRLVGAEQKLLACLSTGIKGARDLRAAKGAVG